MSLSLLLVLVLGFLLAYVNGANDVSKGIATLVGSGVTRYRSAIVWGASWTGAGSIVAATAAKAMVATFGNGFLTSGVTLTFAAAIAMLLGAGLWLVIATRTGLPVSTTHAIVGSVTGVAAVAYGAAGVHVAALAGKIGAPLLVSPAISLALVFLILRRARRHAVSSATTQASDCLCAGVEPVIAPAYAPASNAAVASGLRLKLVTGTREACAVNSPSAARLTIDHLHWLTSGATSFARGMNDAPKIVALVLAAAALEGSGSLAGVPLPLFTAIGFAMVAGSLVGGRRVTEVLAERVTPMNHREGFVANLVTASLVTAGATLGLPMSTTHVASGGIIGAGAQRSSLNRKKLRDIALAWVVTLPASALLGILAYLIANAAGSRAP